jgi:hypothetical protein
VRVVFLGVVCGLVGVVCVCVRGVCVCVRVCVWCVCVYVCACGVCVCVYARACICIINSTTLLLDSLFPNYANILSEKIMKNYTYGRARRITMSYLRPDTQYTVRGVNPVVDNVIIKMPSQCK